MFLHNVFICKVFLGELIIIDDNEIAVGKPATISLAKSPDMSS